MELTIKTQPTNKWIFELTNIGVNIEVRSHDTKKTAWSTITVPDTEPIKVGFGEELPEDVASLDELQVAVRDFVDMMVGALEDKL